MSDRGLHSTKVPSQKVSAPWKKPDDNNDDTGTRRDKSADGIVTAAIPHLAGLALKTMAGITLALYILNQKHMLPRPISAIVSKSLFWPTLPITASRRIGKWMTRVDDTVIIGGAPFGFLGMPEKLYEDYGVRGVINLCEEYKGPVKKYGSLGMEHLYLPTTDHFEPEVEDLISAVSFIRRHQARGNKVYVHCRAGHGRSATAVFAWLLYKDPIVDTKSLNSEFCKLRNVRKTLWKQPNLQQFHERLKTKGTLLIDMQDIRSHERPPKLIDDISSSEEEEEEEAIL